jgi:hypothetical protein
VAKLAHGSRIAFDYFSRELVFSMLGRLFVSTTLKVYYGESFQFGISVRPPARDHVSAFVEQTGLALAEHEPFGRKLLLGGLALAVNNG